MMAFTSSAFRSGELANCSLVLFTACCLSFRIHHVDFAVTHREMHQSSMWKRQRGFDGLTTLESRQAIEAILIVASSMLA